MNNCAYCLSTILIVSTFPSSSYAEAVFQGLGHLVGGQSRSSSARYVSADGKVVVGVARDRRENGDFVGTTFRWTPNQGMHSLGWPIESLGEIRTPNPTGVSDDGKVITGTATFYDDLDEFTNRREAFRWTETAGFQRLGVLDLPESFASEASDISGNGEVIVGTGRIGGLLRAWRWTENAGMQDLSILPGRTNSTANAISSDGSVVVGFSHGGDVGQAFRWTENGGIEPLFEHGSTTIAYAISSNNNVIAGTHGNLRSFRWTEATGFQDLGGVGTSLDPSGVFTRSQPSGVSADGKIIIGNYSNSRNTGLNTPYLWTESDGMRSLWRVLVDDHGLDLSEWSGLSSVRGISDDGCVIVGGGVRNGQPEAWIAALDRDCIGLPETEKISHLFVLSHGWQPGELSGQESPMSTVAENIRIRMNNEGFVEDNDYKIIDYQWTTAYTEAIEFDWIDFNPVNDALSTITKFLSLVTDKKRISRDAAYMKILDLASTGFTILKEPYEFIDTQKKAAVGANEAGILLADRLHRIIEEIKDVLPEGDEPTVHFIGADLGVSVNAIAANRLVNRYSTIDTVEQFTILEDPFGLGAQDFYNILPKDKILYVENYFSTNWFDQNGGFDFRQGDAIVGAGPCTTTGMGNFCDGLAVQDMSARDLHRVFYPELVLTEEWKTPALENNEPDIIWNPEIARNTLDNTDLQLEWFNLQANPAFSFQTIAGDVDQLPNRDIRLTTNSPAAFGINQGLDEGFQGIRFKLQMDAAIPAILSVYLDGQLLWKTNSTSITTAADEFEEVLIPLSWLEDQQAGQLQWVLNPLTDIQAVAVVRDIEFGLLDTRDANPLKIFQPIVLKSNQWAQISLPGPVGAELTIYDLFGDELDPSTYDTMWAIFSYDPVTNEYTNIGLSGRLEQGVGYWIIQITDADKVISIPNTRSTTPSVSDADCNSLRCFSIDAPQPVGDITWSMIGYPFAVEQPSSTFVVSSTEGLCADGCSVEQAFAENIVGPQLWHYDADAEGYELLNNNSFHPWDGLWIAVLPGVASSSVGTVQLKFGVP